MLLEILFVIIQDTHRLPSRDDGTLIIGHFKKLGRFSETNSLRKKVDPSG